MMKFLFILFIGLLPLQIFAINYEYYQRGEEYKEFPDHIRDPYNAGIYIWQNYDKLSKKDGYLTPLPIISEEEIEKIRNGNNQNNLNYGVSPK